MNDLSSILTLAITTTLSFGQISYAEERYDADVEKAISDYKSKNIQIIDYPPHTATGEYLLYGNKRFKESNIITFDKDGIVQYINKGKAVYNIVTLSQFALSWHGRHIRNNEPADMFIRSVDKLVELQMPSGGIPYQYIYPHHGEAKAFESPWFSGMAQGQAISAFARAYELTGAGKYLDAGNIALRFMLTDKADGGTSTTLEEIDPSLADNLFIEEWVTKTASYTLNGYIFSLLGLYDWCHTANSTTACTAFDQGSHSLELVLPNYDVGGFSTYDLTHITGGLAPMLNIYYHKVHIELLRAMASITGNPVFGSYANRWAGYVSQLK